MAEELFRLDRYLDQVFVAGLITVRVVHGKGTGVLKAAVREALSAHPLVIGFRDGYYRLGRRRCYCGGDGGPVEHAGPRTGLDRLRMSGCW